MAGSVADPEQSQPLTAIFLRFLRFGLLAWGGPIAQIALIKRELVDEQQWLDQARFNRLLAIYQVLPGPEAHELCVHLGMMKAGRAGGVAAGLGFMLPGLVLILGLAWIYESLDLRQPLLAALFLGVQIGVIAIVARAVHRIADHALGDRWLWAIAGAAAIGAASGASFWIVLPAAGLAYAAFASDRLALGAAIVLLAASIVLWMAWGPVAPAPSAAASEAPDALALFLSGLKAGLLTFGGAYTAIPFIRGDTVERGWISDGQFLDGLALSGIIPAPLIIFGTFVGYIAGGWTGALAMTAGIFLPAFAFSLIFYRQLERVIENERLRLFLHGVAAGVVGLIAVTAVELATTVAADVPVLAAGFAIFVAALALLYLWKSKLSIPAVVFGSAVAGATLL